MISKMTVKHIEDVKESIMIPLYRFYKFTINNQFILKNKNHSFLVVLNQLFIDFLIFREKINFR